MTTIGGPLLDVLGLDVRFGRRADAPHAVRGLDLAVDRGETVALVGESGCGKSTTALAVLRLLAPGARISGRVNFDGQDLLGLDDASLRQIRGARISMIFQEPMTSLNPVHTVGDQIAETLRTHRAASRRDARHGAIELLERVRIDQAARRVDDYPHQLSGGQRQRVMIAMAVACRPSLLIADEPTTALDVTIQAQILELLDGLRRDLAMGLLLITHDLGVVARWADRVAVMYEGRKVEEAPADRLLAQPQHPYTRGLIGASLHTGPDLHYTEAALPEIRASRSNASESIAFVLHVPPRPAAAPARPDSSPPLLQVEALSVDYAMRDGRQRAVDAVSFRLAAGETLGLVGESGCGKSSLSRTLVRLIEPAAGRILIGGTDVATLSGWALQSYRQQVQMVFQDPFGSLNPRRRVGDILEAVLVVHGVRDRAVRRRRIAEMIDRVGLPHGSERRYPHEFSGGQRQRVGIARALVVRPALLICDEPVSALDVSVQAQILNLLVELKRGLGLSYLFISHDLAMVRYIADRVMVMHQGRIVETGAPDRLWQHPVHPYTQRLLAAATGAERRLAA
ncbi:MAG: ABC transporter ATP-binding protein [Lautropia sp.]